MPTSDLVQLIDNRLYSTREAAQEEADHIVAFNDLEVFETLDEETKQVGYCIVRRNA